MAAKQNRGRFGILVGGGPAPGINGVIHAVTNQAAQNGIEVTGIYDGFKHLMDGKVVGLALTPQNVSYIHNQGGSILRTARAVVPHMLKAGSGKIVNVAAMGGLHGGALMGAYAASKSAVMRLTESMALELREKGINVNCVLPSTIDTPPNRASMPKADPGKWVAPEALADVILFLASPMARAIHGASLPVVGLV
jgi:NAD(P)-dependent dehydrogenase (short-subunit alcohol dehydrogenase family)